MAAAEVKDRGATMFRAGGFMWIAIDRRMCQVPFRHEMRGALDDLSSAWNQRPDEN